MKKKTKNPLYGQRNRTGDKDLVCRSFALNVSTLDKASRSVEAVVATEKPVVTFDMRSGRVIDEVLLMSGLRMPAAGQVPLLDTHSRYSVAHVLGSCRDLRIDGDKLIGRNYLSKRAAADEALTLIEEGHLTDNSVGYRIYPGYTTIEPGASASVKGRAFTAGKDRPLRVVPDWEIFENSLCPIGADDQAKVRADAAPEPHQPHHKEYRSMDFTKWLQERGLKLDDLTEQQASKLRADFDAEMLRRAMPAGGTGEPGIPAPKPEFLREEGRRAELERQEAIRTAAGSSIPAELVERAIKEDWPIQRAKDEFLARLRGAMKPQTGNAPAIIVRDGEINTRQLEAAMLLRAGYEQNTVKVYGEQIAEQADRIRDMSLVDLCREALRLGGKEIPLGREEMIRTAFSTATLPVLLGNVANKSLLGGYEALASTWEKWCQIGSVTDFKEVTRARLTDTGQLEPLKGGGEVAHGSSVEESEKFSIATYAKQFAVTRTDIINDDLGVFTKVPRNMGVKANMRVQQLVYAHFLNPGNMGDNVALFHTASHRNLNASNGLGDTALSTAIQKFRAQVDADKQPISCEPRYLLVPPSLERTARQLIESDLLIATGVGSTAATTPNKNIHKGSLELIVEPRLETAAYTGYSATTYYLVGNPAAIDTLEVAFLNGRRVPTVEQFGSTPDTMGTIFRVYIDCGAKVLDFRGLQKNTA